MQKPSTTKNYLGYGLGLRSEHHQYILANQPPVDWFEIISEDFMVSGGYPLDVLEKIRANYPIVMHGVSLSIGSCDPLNLDYLQQLKQLADRIQPAWISDHLCWTGVNGINTHDLLPIPYTEEALTYLVNRVNQVQDFLGQTFTLENASSYITYLNSEMTEWEFLAELTKRTGCKILLDVNNIYVSAFNHGFNPKDYLHAIPVAAVQQFHLAGHSNFDDYIIDTHDEAIVDGVWKLYAEAVRRFGRVSTMIERDDNIPEFSELFVELQQAKSIAENVLQERVEA